MRYRTGRGKIDFIAQDIEIRLQPDLTPVIECTSGGTHNAARTLRSGTLIKLDNYRYGDTRSKCRGSRRPEKNIH